MKMEFPPEVASDSLSSSSLEQTLERPIIQIHYNPPDDELNFWMFAMIGMGCAFVVFVLGSIYLMCKSPAEYDPAPIRRHPTTKVTRAAAGGTERSMMMAAVTREHI